ncbi:hypothetical protein RyT2_16210 [Pseudolactococcus yaeyamensis]
MYLSLKFMLFFSKKDRHTSDNTTILDIVAFLSKVIFTLYTRYLYLSITLMLQNGKLDVSLHLTFVI